MAYKVLYRKYRPNNFENVVGQDYTVSMLKNAISSGKMAHAYIFTGPRGTGKTSSAKIFAKAINCTSSIDGSPCNECESCKLFNESPDIIEIDAASNNGVEEIRELINNVKLVPTSMKYKVYIIDEVHMLTTSAFNALLLTLEEPPSHVVFILATTDIQNVPITILSRCQRFDFKPVSKKALINRLKFVSNEENIDIDDDAIEEIAVISAGGLRDALGMLDQLASSGNKITLEEVSSNFGSISAKKIEKIIESISESDADKLLELLRNIKESGTNYSVFIDKLILSLRKCAIDIKTSKCDLKFYFDDIYNMIFDLNECLCNLNINVDPYILIEIVLLKYINRESISFSTGNNFLGNNIKKNISGEIKKNNENVGNSIKRKDSSEMILNNNKLLTNNNCEFDIKIRINNVFVNANKEYKAEFMSSWVDFMNSLMIKNRNLVSLLADTSVLAVSDKYAIIQSKSNTTNKLINDSIIDLEESYGSFTSKNIKFAAVDEDLWKKELDTYRFNIKNNIKYSYMDEKISISKTSEEVKEVKSENIEDLAGDIFDSYEVE